jgi:hypothetical protein
MTNELNEMSIKQNNIVKKEDGKDKPKLFNAVINGVGEQLAGIGS